MNSQLALAYIDTRGVSNIWNRLVDGGAPKQLTSSTTGRIYWFDLSRDCKPRLFAPAQQPEMSS
jgi:hypothetical protein